MSNDTNYKIKIKGPTKKVDCLLDYLSIKHELWQKCERKLSKLSGKKYEAAFKQAMKQAGAKKHADFVSWGFMPEKQAKKPAGQAQVELSAWANENSLGNVWISGKDGELACLQARFPDISIQAKFDDEYGKGACNQPEFEKDYTKMFED